MVQGDKVWWYAKGDQKFGPYSSPELKALAAKGSIEQADLIWKEGLANWLLASSVKGLIPTTTPRPTSIAPPPLPATQRKVVEPPEIFRTTISSTSDDIPDEIRGWSWGAFLLNWIWAIGNRAWWGLLALIPFVGLLVAIWLGIKGREIAWRSRTWDIDPVR